VTGNYPPPGTARWTDPDANRFGDAVTGPLPPLGSGRRTGHRARSSQSSADSRHRAKRFLIAGSAVAAIAIAVIVILLITTSGRGGGIARNGAGAITHQATMSPVDLRTGDCAQLPAPLATNGSRTVTAMPCSQSHNAQVYTTVDAANAIYPGADEITAQGLAACQSQVRAYIGDAPTELHVAAFVPDSDGWARGERAEICLLVDRSGNITGDIRAHI
jgi:hypothetical protein